MASILVVDDRQVNRELLGTVLGYRGHVVLQASDGAEALEMVKAIRPDLVISDILMPTMDGYEFVRRLRADRSIAKTRVIFSTAHYLQRESRKLAQACGITTILTKPCEPDVILRVVDEALGIEPAAVTPPPVEEFDFTHTQLLTDKLAEKNDELRIATHRLTALNELGRRMTLKREPSAVVEESCAAARRILGAKFAAIGILKDDSLEIDQFRVVGVDEELAKRLDSATGWKRAMVEMIEQRTPLRRFNPSGDPAELGLSSCFAPVYSVLGVPIVSLERAYGWLQVFNKVGDDGFSEQDEELMTMLAAQLAVTYENARLCDEARQHASRLEQEISERKLAHQALLESEERYRTLAETANDAIFIINPTGELQYINTGGAELFGSAPEELVGKSQVDLFPPEMAREHMRMLQQVFETGKSHYEEEWQPFKDKEIWQTTWLTPIRNAEGDICAVMGIGRDDTARKTAEEALSFVASIVESSQDAIVGKTLDGTIISWNPAAEEIYGYTADEIKGRHISTLAPSDRQHEVVQTLEGIKKGAFLHRYETVRLRKDGTLFDVALAVSPIKDTAGNVIGISTVARDITERKRAEEALRESEQWFQTVIENLTEGVVVSDVSGQLLYWNRAARDMHNVGIHEGLLNLQEFANTFEVSMLDGSILSLEEWPLARVLRGEHPDECEVRVRRIDTNRTRTCSYRGSMAQVPGGKPLAFVTITDVTERKRAEEALRKSEARFRSYFELGLIGMAVNSPSKGFLDVNDRFCEILGYERNELAQIKWSKITHPDDLAADVDNFNRVLAGEIDGYSMYKRFIRKDGKVIDTTISVKCLRRPNGSVDYLVALMQDITERKRAEEESARLNGQIEQERQRLNSIVANVPGVVWEAWGAPDSATQRIDFVSDHVESMLGYGVDEWLSTPNFWLSIVHPDDREEAARSGAADFAAGRSGTNQFRWIARDGRYVWVESNYAVIKDDEGRPVGLRGVTTDITHRRQAEMEIAKTQESAIESERMKSEFLCNMSHELRTPMNGIIGLTDLILLTEVDEEQEKYLELVKECADSMMVLVSNILSLSDMETGSFRPRIVEFNLEMGLKDLTQSYAARAGHKGLSLSSGLSPGVPAVVTGDFVHIRHTLVKLLDNALKFTERGEVEVRVETESQISNELWLRFSVRDTGIGVPADKQTSIFGAFSQVDGSTTRKYGGAGLGLALAKRLIENLGGRIWVESEERKGSTFYFTAHFAAQDTPLEREQECVCS